jgi:hypothetical protein
MLLITYKQSEKTMSNYLHLLLKELNITPWSLRRSFHKNNVAVAIDETIQLTKQHQLFLDEALSYFFKNKYTLSSSLSEADVIIQSNLSKLDNKIRLNWPFKFDSMLTSQDKKYVYFSWSNITKEMDLH